MWPIVLIGPLLVLFTVRLFVSNDGASFVEIAPYLAQGDWANYDFVRDPGFPLLLNATLLGPGGVPSYLIVSGLLISGAVALVGGIFFDVGRPWHRLLAGSIALTASIYISYAGTVLQQPGMAFLLALLGWLLRFNQTAAGLRPLRFLLLAIAGTAAIYFAYVFMPTIILVGISAGVIAARKTRKQGTTKVVAALALGAAAATVPLVAYQPWQALREANSSSFAAGSDLSRTTTQGAISGLRDDPPAWMKERVRIALILLHIQYPREEILKGVPREDWSNRSEDLVWSDTTTWVAKLGDPDPRCGLAAYGMDWVDENLPPFCQPLDGSPFWVPLAQPSYFLGALLSLGFILGSIWAVFYRRSLLPILLIPWAWIALYSLFIPVDRYAMPIWPYKAIFTLTLTFLLIRWITDRVRGKTKDPSEAAELADPPEPQEDLASRV